MLETRLDETETRLEEICEKHDRLRIRYPDVVKRSDSPQRDALYLRARVIESESEVSAPSFFLPRLAETEIVRECDRYFFLLQLTVAQVQDLQDFYADIVSPAKSS